MKTIARWILAAVLTVGIGMGLSPSARGSVMIEPGIRALVDGGGRKVVLIRHRPPAVRVASRTRRPSRRHVWIDGHWRFHRGRFAWVRGHWVVRPHRRAVYVRPRWESRGGGWVLIGGHWR